MKISGQCNRCGDCCKGDPFNTESGREYCPFYVISGDGKGVCTGRGSSYYFKNCARFPQTEAQILSLPRCSYKVEK